MGNNCGIIALIFGIVACLLFVFIHAYIIPIVSLILGILAIVFGAVGISKDDSITMAIIG